MFMRYTGPVFAPEGGGGTPPAPAPGGDTAHPVAAPWASAAEGNTTWRLGETGKERDWWDTIPEPEARAHVQAKGYKNPAELALANYSLTKLQRNASDVLGVPGDNATDDDWGKVYAKLGRPEKPEDYDLKFGDNVKTDEAMMTFGRKFMHAAGVRGKSAQGLADMWNTFVGEQNAAALQTQQNQNIADMQALETRWGADLAANRAAGERVMRSVGLPEDVVNRVEGAIGTAAVVELLAMIGRKSDEGKLIGGNNNGDPNDPANMTKDQAQTKINELLANADFDKKYKDANHPGHKEAVDLIQRLYART